MMSAIQLRHQIRATIVSRASPSSSAPSLCPFLFATADVAVHLILVATIVQLVRRLWFLGRRGYAVESAAARICREAGG